MWSMRMDLDKSVSMNCIKMWINTASWFQSPPSRLSSLGMLREINLNSMSKNSKLSQLLRKPTLSFPNRFQDFETLERSKRHWLWRNLTAKVKLLRGILVKIRQKKPWKQMNDKGRSLSLECKSSSLCLRLHVTNNWIVSLSQIRRIKQGSSSIIPQNYL